MVREKVLFKYSVSNLMDVFTEVNKLFLREQKDLILSGVSERSWYTHFAIYLNDKIKEKNMFGYYVDTEYNRNNGKLKTIFDDKEIEVIPITCDVIVHSRGNCEQDNLICIEMKKSTASKQLKLDDKKRIRLLTRNSFDDVWSADGKVMPEYVCGYKLGVYYEVDIKNRSVYIEYYKNGSLFKKDDFMF